MTPPLGIDRVERRGRASDVWRLRATALDAHLVVRRRRADESEADFIVRFARETDALEHAGALAPRLLGAFPPAILTETVEGRSWRQAPLPQFLEECCRSLAALHRLPPPPSIAAATHAEERLLEYLRHTAGVQTGPRPRGRFAWLHGNANPGNALLRDDGTVCWLDWEDTLVGDPEFDAAYLAGHLAVALDVPPRQVFAAAVRYEPDLDRALFDGIEQVVRAYVVATEERYARYSTEAGP